MWVLVIGSATNSCVTILNDQLTCPSPFYNSVLLYNKVETVYLKAS